MLGGSAKKEPNRRFFGFLRNLDKSYISFRFPRRKGGILYTLWFSQAQRGIPVGFGKKNQKKWEILESGGFVGFGMPKVGFV